MSQTRREFDVVVWGATGFTGRLVAQYLQRHFGGGERPRWALAGRNESRLADVAASIGAGDTPLIVADSNDSESLLEMTARTQVVCTTVGPYALYGSQLVSACVRNGTDYCDLAGEVPWIRKMIDTHHSAAQDSGARIVHCCGFDSVPSDLGVWFLQREAQIRYGEPCTQIGYRLKAAKGGASGGTVASLMEVVKAARADRDVARIVRHPYAFNPPGERDGPDRPDPQRPIYDRQLGAWTAPFVMAAINTKVVRRTNALLGYPYGKDFRYSEAVVTGRGIAGQAKAIAMSAGLTALMVGSAFAPTRWALNTFVLPAQGDGPDADKRENGFFNILMVGTLRDGRTLKARVTADRDPGYGATCGMLAESALCLAADADHKQAGGGCTTPAAALGDRLLDRLEARAGMQFEILETGDD